MKLVKPYKLGYKVRNQEVVGLILATASSFFVRHWQLEVIRKQSNETFH